MPPCTQQDEVLKMILHEASFNIIGLKGNFKRSVITNRPLVFPLTSVNNDMMFLVIICLIHEAAYQVW